MLMAMEEARVPATATRTPFAEGEPVMLVEPEGQRHIVQLRAGAKFHHTRTGHLDHDRIIGSPPGSLLPGSLGVPIVCARLTLEDFVLKRLKRRTSIIHPKDLATLVVRGDLFSGARVLEAGIGSGSASIFLLRAIGPGGQLISWERRAEFIELALSNIRDAHRLLGDPGAGHLAVEGDIYAGFEAEDLDLVLLDVPEPGRAQESAWRALRPGGTLLAWLPTVTQVYDTVRLLQEVPGWELIETRETLERSWEVAEHAMRPFHRMVGHTGFLVRARKLVAG